MGENFINLGLEKEKEKYSKNSPILLEIEVKIIRLRFDKEKISSRVELFDKFSSELEVVEAWLGENGARNEPTSSEFWLGLYVGRVGGSVRCVGARVGVPAYVWNCAGRRDLGRRQVNTPLNSVPQLHACLRTYISAFDSPVHRKR